MFWKLSMRIAYYMLPEESQDDRDIYGYGVWVLLTTLFSTLEIIVFGFVLHCLAESIIYLLLLMIVRTYTGGYHASTSGKCNMMVVGCFLLNLILSRAFILVANKWIALILLLFVVILIWCKAPVEHVNKPLSKREKKKYHRYSIVLSLGICLAVTVLYDRYEFQMIYTTITMLMVVIMMLLELVLQRKEKKNESKCEEGH